MKKWRLLNYSKLIKGIARRGEISLKGKRIFVPQDENPLYSPGFLDRGG